MSQTIAKLEGELGETLFQRSARDGSLTDAGEVLREYALKMLNLRTEAGAALLELRSLHRGQLSLAANEYTCLYLLPVLDRFRRAYPRLKITVQRSLGSRIADEVLSHSVEIGVLSFRPEDRALRSIVVFRDYLAFVVNPSHRLAKLKLISIRDLGEENFIAHNTPSPQRAKVLETFQRYKTPLRIGMELPSLEAVRRSVEMGDGVALVPGLTVERELASGRLIRVAVKELAMERKLRLVHRREAALSHAAVAFLREVEAFAEVTGGAYTFQPERE